MSKPRIIVFSTAYHPFIGGAEIAIQEVAKRLKREFDFFIVTSLFRKDLARVEGVSEGKIIRVGVGTKFDQYLLPFLGFFKARRLLNKSSLLWGVDIGTGSLAALFLKIFYPSRPFVFTIQYGYGDKRIRSGRVGMINLSFRAILRYSDWVTVISSYLGDLARKYGYRGSMSVIHNGVEIQKFQNLNPKFQTNSKLQNPKFKTVITTSRLVPKNGIDVLIAAIAEVKKTMPDVQCHIIGDGPERRSLELQTTNYQLQNNVKFFGSVPYEKIPEYLHNSDVFVRPSRSEGMGNSFVEALVAGLPIIGTAVGGIPDIIKDNETGFFCKSDDPLDLASKIVEVLHSPEMVKKTFENGRRLVEKEFEWGGIARSYDVVFKQILLDPLRIAIATPLMPPQLGGPALYADKISQEFRKSGHPVRIASFGRFLKYPPLFRHALYFFALARISFRADVILALDYFSVGVPAAFVSFIFSIPLVLRMEGDFLWEHFVERSRHDIVLPMFYQSTPALSRKERFIKAAMNAVLRQSSRIVFSSEWRRSMVLRFYPALNAKTVLIKNAWPSRVTSQESVAFRSNTVLWAGRMLYLKNLHRVARVFGRINDPSFELHFIGEGPLKEELAAWLKSEGLSRVRVLPSLSRDELLQKIHSSAFVVLPSLSDVGPNFVAEAVMAGIPFVVTQESGYFEDLKDLGLFVDPLNDVDLEQKIRQLMDSRERSKIEEKIKSALPALGRDWGEVAHEFGALFDQLKDRA